MVSSHPAPRPDGRERQGETRARSSQEDGGDGAAVITGVCWKPTQKHKWSRTSGDGPEPL